MDCGKDFPQQGPDAAEGYESRWRSVAPAVSLLLLAPVVSEVLLGATRLSVLFVLIPEIAIWGAGALLIRHAVRRCGRGWPSLLLLGLALAVAEECLIQQTSLAPPAGLANRAYGRVWGVNWVYFLWALGYESVWVVVLPVQLTELLFRNRRNEPWVAKRGLILSSLAFVLGSLAAWYSWTQVARSKVFHMPEYQPPVLHIALAVAAILVLVAAAFSRWTIREPVRIDSSGSAPGAWLAGLIAFVFALPWTLLVLLAYGLAPAIPFGVPMVGGAIWACAVLAVFTRWTTSRTWSDMHRFAVVFGGVAACMAGGFVIFAVGGALAIDWIGKLMINLFAILAFICLGRKLRNESEAAGE
jgi:hypothetical protein